MLQEIYFRAIARLRDQLAAALAACDGAAEAVAREQILRLQRRADAFEIAVA